MSLDLDKRQRAMLGEMGVRVWTPEPVAGPARVEAAPRDASPAGVQAPGRPVLEGAPESIAADVHLTMDNGQKESKAAARTRPAAVSGGAPLAPRTGVALQPRPPGIELMDWPALQDAVAHCRACALCHGRTKTVFGVGDVGAEWMVVGEAPGEQEDLQGEPFVGPSGQLLDNMLKAVGLSRHAGASGAPAALPEPGGAPAVLRGVYIANVVKCRPPGNRNPHPDEVAQCDAYLARQVALVRPRIILAMGRFAVQSLLQTAEPIGKLRGRVHHYQGVPVIVTYHPAYLLRSLSEKAKAWADLCLALEVVQHPGGV
jgi:uracil-DNA glycosylase